MKRLLGTVALLISCVCAVNGSELRETIERYDADRRAVSHIYSVCPSGRAGGSRRFGSCFNEPSAARLARYRSFYQEWLGRQVVDKKIDGTAGRVALAVSRSSRQRQAAKCENSYRSSARSHDGRSVSQIVHETCLSVESLPSKSLTIGTLCQITK